MRSKILWAIFGLMHILAWPMYVAVIDSFYYFYTGHNLTGWDYHQPYHFLGAWIGILILGVSPVAFIMAQHYGKKPKN